MNFERIARMAICYWSEEGQNFVVRSPIFGQATGVGDTPQAARISFDNSLASAKEDFEHGLLAGALDNTNISLQAEISSRTDLTLNRLSRRLDCSVSEAIDYLALFYEHARLIDQKLPGPTGTVDP